MEEKVTATWQGKTVPLVSVICPTFNHECYLLQAIESILAQETTFPFEIVIHDDASTDSTARLVEQLMSDYPLIVRGIFQKENQYSRGFKITPLVTPHTRGKYIAFCEGDDYWTSPDKLQKQVDILEANPRLAVCGHLCLNVDENGRPLAVQAITGLGCPVDFTIADALHGTPIHPSSWVYRRCNWSAAGHDKLLNELPAADDPMMLILLAHGAGHCIREFLSAYRLHPGGSWSTTAAYQKSFDMLRFRMAAFRLLPATLVPRHWIVVSRSFLFLCRDLSINIVRTGDMSAMGNLFHRFRMQQTLMWYHLLAAAVAGGVFLPILVAGKAWRSLPAALENRHRRKGIDG